MKTPARTAWLVAIMLLTCSSKPARAGGADRDDAPLGPVDFRYAPPWWQSAICLPDDPDKTLVGKDGELLFDFGRGGVRNFGICLRPGVVSGARWIRQATASPRAPIVQTWLDAAGVEVVTEAFVAIPPAAAAVASRIERVDGQQRFAGWAKPARPCAAEFTGADVSFGGKPIELRLSVPAGAARTLVFGLCEGWHKEPGRRPLELRAEGATSRIVDPVKDFGPNQPGLYRLKASDANRDGHIEIAVASPPSAEDHNAVLNMLWVFEGDPPADLDILAGHLAVKSRADAFFAGVVPPQRRVVVLATLRNTTATEASRQPALVVESIDPVGTGRAIEVGSSTRVRASEPATLAPGGPGKGKTIVLPALTLAPGAARQVAWTIDRNCPNPPEALVVAQAVRARDAARAWWEHADLPFGTIQVPDPGIQGMLESCVRNIWQAREIKKGLPAFHVGPTVYRGLWVVDGSFLLESAAILGRGADARAGVEYLLSHQKPDGSFELLPHFWKENGIVLWAATRHAVLTQDKGWLRGHWPQIKKTVQAIRTLRDRASKDPGALEYGLLPPGEVDGGISNATKPEYSNTCWCLAGLKAAVAAAHWLGEEADASAWQAELDDFLAVYRKAATRDARKDSHGNTYVPTMMGDIDHHVPQRGQWAFCHMVYPGEVFPVADPLVTSQLAMLRATKVEGLIYDTGWMHAGIWSYFASFYGHAVLREGHGREAAHILYDFARHAAPLRDWREEQKPVGKGSDEVGDMPHNWASAEFIRLCAHLLELDRGDELHLLEGFPREWAGPGMTTRLDGVLTPFGPLQFSVSMLADGKTALLKLSELKGRRPAKIVVHLGGLTGKEQTMDLPTDGDVEQTITR